MLGRLVVQRTNAEHLLCAGAEALHVRVLHLKDGLEIGRRPRVAADAARWEPYRAADLAAYFRTLDFTLGPAQLAGIAEFAQVTGLRTPGSDAPPVRLLGGDPGRGRRAGAGT